MKNLRTWLFNPFHYVAGGSALGLGVIIILAGGLVGSLSNSHFDGVLDFHTGASASLGVFLAEGPIDWLIMSVLLLVGGMVISRSRVRWLDVFGTQALARVPTLVTALVALLPGYQRFTAELVAQLGEGSPGRPSFSADTVVFGIVAVVILLMIVWMVALMYRGFSISCNVSGTRAIGVFVAVLVLAEIASKLAIIPMVHAGP